MENCLKALEDEYGDMKEQFDVSCYRNRHLADCRHRRISPCCSIRLQLCL